MYEFDNFCHFDHDTKSLQGTAFAVLQYSETVVIYKNLFVGDHQDITPAILPMFHIYGLTCLCLYQLRLGCQILTFPKFTPDLLVRTLKDENPTVLYVAPPIGKILHYTFSAYSDLNESIIYLNIF